MPPRSTWLRGRAASGFQRAAQQFDVLGNLDIGLLEFFDPAHPVHDGGVVAPAKAAAKAVFARLASVEGAAETAKLYGAA